MLTQKKAGSEKGSKRKEGRGKKRERYLCFSTFGFHYKENTSFVSPLGKEEKHCLMEDRRTVGVGDF